jgi:excisionase family DNA binding protein
MDANHHAPDGNDFATVEETQKRCRVTRKTVEAWIESGELPHYRLGPRTIRIAIVDLEEFLAARRYAGIPPELRSAPAPASGSPDIRSKCSAGDDAGDIRSRYSSEDEPADSRTAAA